MSALTMEIRLALCVLLASSACILAEENEERRSKLPFIADAVGNTLPPPSNVPATVGSPVNLLTPDRYEFYTFDESGELVKRLMTLEEIQAIVAAGEETEGLVTFANENQPTVALNFSQPPYNKVHNVVTNVQNVLKAQMEAHKKKPLIQPTLDTPDVSDSWSLILPSIFGNTGVDIIPDKLSGTFSTPETETIEIVRPDEDSDLSKEGDSQVISSSSTTLKEVLMPSTVKETVTEQEKIVTTSPKPIPKPSTTTSITTSTTTTTTTTKPKPITTTRVYSSTNNIFRRSTTTSKPRATVTTTIKPRPVFTTTVKAKATTITNTVKPRTTTTTTTVKPRTTTTTTVKPKTTTSTTVRYRLTTTTTRPQSTTTTITKTTEKPVSTTKFVRTTQRLTTVKPYITTKKHITPSTLSYVIINNQSNAASSVENSGLQYEKISTFVPISAASYVTDRTTRKPVSITKTPLISSTIKISAATTARTTTTPKPQPSITTYKPSSTTQKLTSFSTTNQVFEKSNVTTITTQSVSPSTTISSTEFLTAENIDQKPSDVLNDPVFPLFDVAQSISQIATDLGNYRPIPTDSNIADSTQANAVDLESKENLEIEIPADTEVKLSNTTEKNTENFVKISTLDPPNDNKSSINEKNNLNVEKTTTYPITEKIESSSTIIPKTTIDPIMSESMDDLLSQIVHQSPQSIVNIEQTSKNKNQITATVANPENIKNSTSETIASNVSNKVQIALTDEQIKEASNDINDLRKETSKNNTNEVKQVISPTIEVSKNEEVTKIIGSISENKGDTKTNIINIATIEPTTINEAEKYTVNKTLIKIENEAKEESMDSIKLLIPASTESLTKETDIITTVASKVVEMTTLSSISEKEISSPDVNKISSNIKDNKTPDFSPKIDDFKKKIQKVNIDDKEFASDRNNSWKLISTVSPPKAHDIPKDQFKPDMSHSGENNKNVVLEISKENQGLEVTTKDLGEDIAQFTQLCNELAFRFWNTMVENIDKRRSFVLSPYSITSMLAMMFMGAKGATSGEMNEILKLDDMVTFNPHFTLKNISDSIVTSPEAGVIVSVFVRELYSDRNRGKILTFYKERAQHFYSGHVEEINFKLVSDIIRRRTNLLVKRYTWGRITEYMKANTVNMQPPLAAFSANIFQTDCTGSSVEGRDGEMYFVVSPNVRQRRLVPVPSVVYRSGFLAGYDPVLDATAAALGNTNSIVSTVFLMPGQQGSVVHGEDLEALEKRLLDSNPTVPTWNRLLRTLLPRIGLELQIPRFSHKSIFNVSSTLKTMGLKDLFNSDHADLGGLNGPSKDLFLSDMVQSTTFVTCGEGVIADQHHIEEYPESLGPQRRRTSRWVTGWDEPRDYQRAFHDPHDVGDAMNLPLHLRPRQARLPARNAQPARLKFDRPFLYFVRHNPSGMILYVGRYNPRLLP